MRQLWFKLSLLFSAFLVSTSPTSSPDVLASSPVYLLRATTVLQRRPPNHRAVNESLESTAENRDNSVQSAQNDCRTATVVSGDSCGNLVARCGIRTQELALYNPDSNFCSTLYPGQRICCSRGSLPDTQPKANVDGTCKVYRVQSGDGCYTLATKCGISARDLELFNPDPNFCSTLAVNQPICCSLGRLPDFRPQVHSDATCFDYQVQSGDSCSTIAATHSLKISDLKRFNDGATWGWSGCENLMANIRICLSVGLPPHPDPQAGAICGPTKPGTIFPKYTTNFTSFNPCPINACCNIWGQCGTTSEFCIPSISNTGNPGTAKAGENGCISNCGEVWPGGPAVRDFKRIGYFESWNEGRECLRMQPRSIDTKAYTHVHWAFADINQRFDITVKETDGQFAQFKALKARRIVSFGGWAFSTEKPTYELLRQVVTDHRNEFAMKIVRFVQAHGLDGVDIDWEYPGAPDIPGIPPGLASDGPNYLAFLKVLRNMLPPDKSLSIAIPASYWYLRAFPLSEMAKVVDYFVVMAYDLAGQWNYGGKWAASGCPDGKCLRSHVNLTETISNLRMIQKAGVAPDRLTVGISSYGRSFKMVNSNCRHSMCSFTGPISGAAPGRCTNTPGYLANAEIYELLADEQRNALTWFDLESSSDIMMYDKDQWVAFMSPETKANRIEYYQAMGFGGIVDWAIDLNDFEYDDDSASSLELEYPEDNTNWDLSAFLPPPCDRAPFATLDDLQNSLGSFPPNCQDIYTLQTLINILDRARAGYIDIGQKRYDEAFKKYAEAAAKSAPDALRGFLQKHGNEYFDCTVKELTLCCAECSKRGKPEKACRHCFTDGPCFTPRRIVQLEGVDYDVSRLSMSMQQDSTPHWNLSSLAGISNITLSTTRGWNRSRIRPEESPPNNQYWYPKFQQVPEPCPPDESQRGGAPGGITWHLREDQKERFYSDIESAAGIRREKIKIGTDGPWYNVPTVKEVKADDIPNPKVMVEKAVQNAYKLSQSMKTRLTELKMQLYYGNTAELVEAMTMPVLMIESAVESMKQIVKVGDHIREEEDKAIVLGFVTGLLFFLPVAGEVMGAAAGMAELSAVMSSVSLAGSIGVDVYTIVDDPANAPLAIFGLVLAPLDLAFIAKAAGITRGLRAAELAKLGNRVEAGVNKVRGITQTCRR